MEVTGIFNRKQNRISAMFDENENTMWRGTTSRHMKPGFSSAVKLTFNVSSFNGFNFENLKLGREI